MKLLLDENVALSTADLCRDLGYDVLEVKREGLQGEEDEPLLALAVSQERVVLSFDKDFGNLIRFPLATHCGVIVIDLHDQRPSRVNERLRDVLPGLAEADLRQKLVIIRDGDVRIRSAPV
jgi:predicted nuclease of predicted toxin-antitoxin system